MPLELPAGLGSLSLPNLPGIPSFPSLPSIPSIPSVSDILGGTSAPAAISDILGGTEAAAPVVIGGSRAPSSQKAGDRPISFLLDNQSEGAPTAFVDFVVRPEDLSWTDSSRMTVNQTLGGAWADNFGKNIARITISGHTGWRATPSSSDDGLARFKRLKDNVFDQWHALRQKNIDDGLDPNTVRLIFSDALDDRSVVVAPENFVLRRSRARPLLVQFQISLFVLDDALQNAPYPAQFGFNGATGATPGPLGDLTQSLGLSSLTGSIGAITSQINGVRSMVQSSLLAPVQSFMQQSAQVFGAVQGAISSGVGLARDVISVAQGIAQTGVNVFHTLAAVAAIPDIAKAGLMAIGSAYTNIFCVLKNALGSPLSYQDFSDLFGSSNCSSTAGGRPPSILAGVNPFYQVSPSSGIASVNLSAAASGAIQAISAADPVLSPMGIPQLDTALRTVTAGISFPAVSLPSFAGSLSGGFFG